jgi:hypothetical protein
MAALEVGRVSHVGLPLARAMIWSAVSRPCL